MRKQFDSESTRCRKWINQIPRVLNCSIWFVNWAKGQNWNAREMPRVPEIWTHYASGRCLVPFRHVLWCHLTFFCFLAMLAIYRCCLPFITSGRGLVPFGDGWITLHRILLVEDNVFRFWMLMDKHLGHLREQEWNWSHHFLWRYEYLYEICFWNFPLKVLPRVIKNKLFGKTANS